MPSERDLDLRKVLQFSGPSPKLDPAVLQKLPPGCTVKSVTNQGASFWGATGRIDISLAGGEDASCFIKVNPGRIGEHMVEGEFESMRAIYGVVPEFVPKPLAWGTLESDPGLHFFLCEFRGMRVGELPDPDCLAALLSRLHRDSESPEGKFGFGTTTYPGKLPQYVGWERSWEAFFKKSMEEALKHEKASQGGGEELEELSFHILNTVIPRLLGPLERDGRSVKPSLVHGDLWHGNSGVSEDTGQPLVFDAACFYAHHEYELGQWRPPSCLFKEKHFTAYKLLMKPSPPEEDYEGRLDLYRLRFDTHVSALFPESKHFRTQVLEVMRSLVVRYGPASMN